MIGTDTDIDPSPLGAPRVGHGERLALALDRTGVVLSAQACAYLVDLLATVWPEDQPPDASIAGPAWQLALRRASDRAGRLRAAGDAALLRAGLFRDALDAQPGARDNNRQVGRLAFVELSGLLPMEAWQRAKLYAELARCFDDVAEVLVEIGDAARSETADGLAFLAERYLREERAEDRARLTRRGLMVPTDAVAVQ